MTTDVKQTEMFPERARRSALSYDIPSAYSAAERALPTIGEKAQFFATFGKYAKTLDVEHDRETVLLNLKVAREKVGDLLGAIDQAEQQLAKTKELEAEMSDIEEKLGIPASERWDGRRGENRHNIEDPTVDDFDDDEEEEELDVQGGADDSVPHTLEDGSTGLEDDDEELDTDEEQVAEGAAER